MNIDELRREVRAEMHEVAHTPIRRILGGGPPDDAPALSRSDNAVTTRMRAGKRRLSLSAGDLVEFLDDSGDRSLWVVGSRPWKIRRSWVITLNGMGACPLRRCRPIGRPQRLGTAEGRAEVRWQVPRTS